MFNGESLTGIQWRLINVWIWQSPERQVSWCQEMAATKVRRSSELLANTVRMNIHWFPTPDLAPLGSVSQPPCGHRAAGQSVLWYRPVWCSAPVYQSCFTPQQVNTSDTSIKTSTTTLNNFTTNNNVNILYIISTLRVFSASGNLSICGFIFLLIHSSTSNSVALWSNQR